MWVVPSGGHGLPHLPPSPDFVVELKTAVLRVLRPARNSMSLLPIYAVTGVTVVSAASAAAWLSRNKKTPEQREALRRQRISTQGRITDGTVLDVCEYDYGTGQTVRMVLYAYQVAGVQYECAQEVTNLRSLFDLNSHHIGSATGVRYDPHHPGNSIVVAETWCGLRVAPQSPTSLQ